MRTPDLFGQVKYPELLLPQNVLNRTESELFATSAQIVESAISEYHPYAIGIMLSGGDDSITALQVALMLGVRIDFIMHGVTGTGLKDCRKYVHEVADRTGIKLIEANAGNTFEDYVMRKGFFGKGVSAHQFSYHLLKFNPFRAALSNHIVHKKRGRKVLLLNGVRVEESENRADNFGDNPIRITNNQVWVNIIHWWTRKQCLELLQAEGIERSPVAVALGRSGECNCGTVQNEANRIACSAYDPEWGDWMKRLRKAALQKFGWDIGQNPSKKRLEEIKAATQKTSDFMPMCVGCKAKQSTLFEPTI
jgi:3'-phosphoadenosine 5'-phosphosulfate sulfotransferase (PAPS reductase)/FAD synthetase